MQTCPHCGKESAATEAYCYGCGHILPSALGGLVDSTGKLSGGYESLEPRRRWGTAYFDQRNRLQLNFRDSGTELTIEILGEVVLGRAHNEPDVDMPDVDLTRYGAVEKGVSRRHVALAREHDTISISDLGSANSTFLNGQRLLPHEPRILRDNDELRLGRLVIRVAFV